MNVQLVEQLKSESYSHRYVTIRFIGIPKIVEIMLNSLRYYDSISEDGFMSDPNNTLYVKWRDKLRVIIRSQHIDLDEDKIIRLAQENAQYFLSVFHPVNIIYTTSYEQYYKIMAMSLQLSQLLAEYNNYFSSSLSNALKELVGCLLDVFKIHENELKGYIGEKSSIFSLQYLPIAERRLYSKQSFGDSFYISYRQSFLYLSEAVKYKPIYYEGQFFDHESGIYSNEMYTPDFLMLTHNSYEEWSLDLKDIADTIPLARKLNIIEAGTIEDWSVKLQHTDTLRELRERTYLTLWKLYRNKAELRARNEDIINHYAEIYKQNEHDL